MSEIKFTSKQREILTTIKHNAPCTVYDILEKIPYDCKRDAMLHSIRILANAGYVERLGRVKKDGASYMTFGVTSEALKVV